MNPPIVLAVVLVGVVGTVIGSFLGVVADRVPKGESVVRPPSACPPCGRRIRPWHNVPVLGWLVLRGKCADCSEPIGVRYLLIEVVTGLAFAGVTAAVLLGTGTVWLLPALLYLAAISVVLTVIDIDVHRLPDVIVLPSYPVLVLLLVPPTIAEGDWWLLARAVLGGLAGFVVFLLPLLVYPAGMGGGDVKLAGVLGLVLAWVGWGSLVVGLFAGFLLGGVVGVTLLMLRLATRKTALPFGPYMIVGAWLGLAFGESLTRWYLDGLVA